MYTTLPPKFIQPLIVGLCRNLVGYVDLIRSREARQW